MINLRYLLAFIGIFIIVCLGTILNEYLGIVLGIVVLLIWIVLELNALGEDGEQ